MRRGSRNNRNCCRVTRIACPVAYCHATSPALTILCVFLTEATSVSRSKGLMERRLITCAAQRARPSNSNHATDHVSCMAKK